MEYFEQIFKDYLDQSKYGAFNVRNHSGHWRQLTLRTNQCKEILAIVIFDKQDLVDVGYVIGVKQRSRIY